MTRRAAKPSLRKAKAKKSNVGSAGARSGLISRDSPGSTPGPATILREDKLRAIRRRQQKARAVDRARRFLSTWGPYWYSRLRSQPHVSKRFAVTPKPCSCFVCGNRRKVEGPSISERRRIVEALS